MRIIKYAVSIMPALLNRVVESCMTQFITAKDVTEVMMWQQQMNLQIPKAIGKRKRLDTKNIFADNAEIEGYAQIAVKQCRWQAYLQERMATIWQSA